MNRILAGVTRAVTKPWQMYPVGLLFGLGFDTATEVSLLVLAGGAAAFALPWYAILTLPILFAAGMSLLDTIDGCFMNFAYGWAFSKPVRKVYYNITITGLSVAVALVIGTIELVSILADKLGITTGPLAAVAGLDLNHVGYAIVVLFVLTWVVALAVWRLARIEERWTRRRRGLGRRPGPLTARGGHGRRAGRRAAGPVASAAVASAVVVRPRWRRGAAPPSGASPPAVRRRAQPSRPRAISAPSGVGVLQEPADHHRLPAAADPGDAPPRARGRGTSRSTAAPPTAGAGRAAGRRRGWPGPPRPSSAGGGSTRPARAAPPSARRRRPR